MTPDGELLRRYTETNSEHAFAELVERHLNLVYSAALRQVNGDAHLAQDVAQTVFADLAHKAASLARRPVLTGWLYTSAHFAAAKAVRTERRRHTREEEARLMNPLLCDPAPDLDWEKLRPVLDAAMLELNETDREAVLLRYFDNRPHAEIAGRLGLSENAARMRVDRALEKLRTLLVRRGATTTAALSGVISANAVQVAPAGLAITISTTAALAGTTLATAATATATKAIAMTALHTTLVVATVAVLAGVGIYEARQAAQLRERVQTLRQQQRPLPSASNDDALVTLRDKIELLASQNAALTSALAQANADKVRLAGEREQAKRAAALFKELADQAGSKDTNPTNAYPTSRHVWAAFGRMGRLAALSKEDDSKLSPEEKSALETARMTALDELPNLMKAAKQFEAAKPSGTDLRTDEVIDEVACLLYGALNLDEQQFNEVYGVMLKLQQEAKQKGLSKETPAPEAAEALKPIMEQWKAETQTLLTPEQARIFAEVVTHFQVEPGKFGFNFNF